MKYFKKSIFWLWFKWYSITKVKTGSNRIPLLLLRFLGRVEYRVEGVAMNLSPYEFFWRQMMGGKITNDPVLNYLKKHLPQNGSFLDIGANIGFFSCWAAINRNANVFSIEPSSREINILKMNLNINNH